MDIGGVPNILTGRFVRIKMKYLAFFDAEIDIAPL